MMNSADIRQAFLDFFLSKGHTIVPSAPIVVKDDPSLMFTNAGMNQFKDYFLGNRKPFHYRVADTQKCLRVSGKHNDLEEVGVDTYHHTMFEMLGNWSFGDPTAKAGPAGGYFKKEAIAWSWELLTEVYKIPADRLYVTVFEGDKKEHIPVDEEAMNEWKKYVDPSRILPFGKKENFWEMGETGPCGPCTEIHIDCRSDEERVKEPGKTLVNRDHPEVIEIWNNVFIQYNRSKDGKLESLPAKHVDTGMGLERLVRVLQEKSSNYDTDIFTGTINEIEKITGKRYLFKEDKKAKGKDSPDQQLLVNIAFRVIADHIRAIAFTIADGQLPSNTGAGYVIRRILRRAVRYQYSYLDYKQPMLNQLIAGLALQFKDVFPELYKQSEFVTKVVSEEEDAFLRTLEKGIVLFNNYTSNVTGKGNGSTMTEDIKESINIQSKYDKERKEKIIAGQFAFELNDTFGFPLDLTSLMAREIKWTVDVNGFEKALREQKDRSRAATAIDAGDWVLVKDGINQFVGYDYLEARASVLKYRKVKAKGKESYHLVLDTTPFYAESGGQVGDTGELVFPSPPELVPGSEESAGVKVLVTDTKKENDLIIHFTDILPEEITGTVIAKVEPTIRKNTELHHTATHLLHAALRKRLGIHVAQKGSLVNSEHLRFDFSHYTKLTEDEIAEIEMMVNEKIRDNIPVVIKQMPRDEAMKLGAMALFGEKYGEIVRVVIIDPNYSVELCGGTHVSSTGELGIFKITAETAVAAGVRRVEAVAGKNAEEYINDQLRVIRSIRESLKNPKDLQKSMESFIQENADLKRKVEHLEARQLVVIRNELLHKAEYANGIRFIGEIIEVSAADALKKLCFELKHKLDDHVAILCANIDGKAHVAIGISEKVIADKKLDAGKIVKDLVAPLIKGGGGGQKELATAGGSDVSRLREVIERVRALLA